MKSLSESQENRRPGRKAFAELAYRECGLTHEMIANYLGVSGPDCGGALLGALAFGSLGAAGEAAWEISNEGFTRRPSVSGPPSTKSLSS